MKTMKTMKNLIAIVLILFTGVVSAQVYDGMTQPTKVRIALPSVMNTEGTQSVNLSPFVGYKLNATETISVTPVLQYNTMGDAVIPQLWVNKSFFSRVWVLAKMKYNMRSDKADVAMSATTKLTDKLHVDYTLNSITGIEDGIERQQALLGYDFGVLVINSGYSFTNNKGYVGNVRWRVTKTEWIQAKYDAGMKQFALTALFHFK